MANPPKFLLPTEGNGVAALHESEFELYKYTIPAFAPPKPPAV